MDLLSEASNGAGRLIAARHIIADRSPPETNHAINSTLLCHSYNLQPDFNSYFAALHTYAWVMWPCGLLVLIATCVLYVITLRAALLHWRECFTNVMVVLAVYPIVAAAAYLAIVIPRGRILAEAIAQEAVMIAMYHLFCMMVKECGGPEQLIRRASGARLETRVLPCCCWPCCVIPRPLLQKRNLTWLRYLVLQMAVVQACLYIIILTLWAEDIMLYQRNFVYLQPFIAASILTGVWGIVMSVRASESAGHRPRPRFLVLQLVLIIVKLQCGFAKVLPEMLNIPCLVALHPSVFVNMIQNSFMMIEMLLLSIWAYRLYSVPPGKDLGRMPNVVVAVLEDNGRAMQVKKIADYGIENKSFCEQCVERE